MVVQQKLQQTVIHIRDLTKRFPLQRGWRELLRSNRPLQWTTALEGLNLDVQEGEILALIGGNGAGKTTLIKILSTLLLPSSGRAEIMNCDVVKSPMEVRAAVGWCLDTERSFYHRLTGVENLSFFAALNNINSANTSTRVGEVLDMVGLAGAGKLPFRVYSRGMQQKLGVARALLTDPAILLLDEPTKSLDPKACKEFWRFVRGLMVSEMKKTIVVVTHNLQEARLCCDRIALLSNGRITAIGAWTQVERHMQAQGFNETGKEVGVE